MPQRKRHLQLVRSNMHTGVVFVPRNFNACHAAGVDPLMIAVLFNSAGIPDHTRERLLDIQPGNIEIFEGQSGNLVLTLRPISGIKPLEFERCLRGLGWHAVIYKADPDTLEQVCIDQLGRSLRSIGE